ncbi:hypothetical protein ABMC86_001964 [Vibrio vulnificus]
MTLETEVQALTKASTEQTAVSVALAQEVAGKMADIDAKVKEATQAVPGAVSAQANVIFYVDVNGSDENGNGKSSNPFKSIRHAIYQTSFNAHVTVRLSGAEDSQSPHIIDQIIDIGARKVTIQFYNNHVRLSDNLSLVFTGQHGCCLHFSDYGSGTQHIHMDTEKVLLSSNGQVLLHMGGYHACNFYINESAKLTLMQTNYSMYPRGISVITAARVRMKNSSGSEETQSEVIAVNTNQAGSVFISYWQSLLGSNYKDHIDSSRVANLVGSLNVVSM